MTATLLPVLALLLLSSPSSTLAQQRLTFSNNPYNTAASWVFGSIDQFVRPLNAPITYVTNWNSGDSDNAWATAPAGSWFLWGTQPDMSISTDMTTWWYTSGTADTNAHIDSRDVPLNFPNVVTLTGGTIAPGNALCNHRTTFNRFYLMGNVNTKTSPYAINVTSPASGNAVVNTYFAWVTNDGQIWNQVMNNGSSYAMAQQRAAAYMNYPFCVVDQKERVYLVGGQDAWLSTDLAVSWNKVASTSYPSARIGMSGHIYSPTPTTDTIVLIGGQQAANSATHFNDVWSTTNGGVSWSQLTANAPWSPRRDGIFAINNNGVMVYLGGDLNGGSIGGVGGVFSDAYVSVNGGSQWYLLAQAPTVNVNITLAASAFDANGYLWLVTGQTAYGTNYYNWTSTIQKSSLSFNTPAITGWSSSFVGGQTFTTTATAINALNTGAWPQGGNKTAMTSAIVPISAFTCVNTLLPTAGPFNMSLLDGGNGWGTSDTGIAQTVAPIVYQNPWSSTSASIDPYTGYWIGSSWSVAPAGSWVLWGSNPDVAISTNLGLGWSSIAGIGGAGLGTQGLDYYNAPFSGQDAGFGNSECAHRSSFNRFYIIGNNQHNNNASWPFFAWAANEAQTWSQVMDAASGVAMTADPNTADCVCWVDRNDNVYFMGSVAIWMSSTLGQTWTRMASSSYPSPRQYMASVIFAPTATTETVIMLGGQNTAGTTFNDVWTTRDYGMTWTQTASAAGFAPRASPQVGVALNGAIIMQGGWYGNAGSPSYLSDAWVTVNYGSTWYQLTSATPIARALGSGIVDPYGYFYVDSGRTATSWGVADVWKSTLSLNNIALWGPTYIPGFTTPASFACTQGTPPVLFDFVSTAGSPGWGAIDQFIRVTNVPVPYVTSYGTDNINNWGMAPAGSWMLFGTQPDVSISTNNGATWTITSGVASSNPHLDTRDIAPNFPGTVGETAGNAGCGHRGKFNRFYLMGNVVGGTSSTTTPWFNWATHDGSIWYQVMTNATSYAMAMRSGASSPGNYPAQCFVDQQDRVYSVGGADTWMSSDLGVTFRAVSTTAYWPARVNFAGAIYSPTATTDTIVIMGGEGAQDAWQSTNGGMTWTSITNALPWGIRGNMNFGVAQNNVFVVMGGDCRSGTCGPNGTPSQGSPGLTVYNDVWISVNYGSSWNLVTNAQSTAPLLSLAAVSFDTQGYMYIVAGQGSSYGSWTSAQYKSTLSLLNITTWAPQLASGTPFTPPASFGSPAAGLYSLGGPKGAPVSSIVPSTALSCGPVANLPTPSNGVSAFDFVSYNNTNGWGTSDIGLQATAAPILYELPYTNTVSGQYWEGNAWGVAPAGSWLIWGSNPDVALSTNQGATWTTISGITGAGFPNTTSFDYAPAGALLYNAECGHRATFNRFYIIGNSDPIGTYTIAPFFAWASDDGLTWTQVMDNATSWSMAATKDINSGQCVVGSNDVVYYIGGSAMWQSSSLGTTFTSITPAAGAGSYMGSSTLGYRQNPTAVIYSPTVGKDTIIVVGGGGNLVNNNGFGNDVWSTADYGNTWTALTLSAGWRPRQSPNVAIGLNGVMVLYGGMAWTNNTAANTYGWSWFSDVWISLNAGSNWYLLNSNSVAGPRAYGGMIVDTAGYVFVAQGSAIWSNWLSSAYRSPYSLYNVQQWLPMVNASIPIPPALCPVGSTPNTNGGGSSSSSSSSGLSNGAIAGIVIGSVVGVVLLLTILFFICFRGRSEKKATAYDQQPEHSQVTQSDVNTTHEVEMAESHE